MSPPGALPECIRRKVARVFYPFVVNTFYSITFFRITDSFLYKYLYTQKEQALFSVRDHPNVSTFIPFHLLVSSLQRRNSKEVRSRICTKNERKIHFSLFWDLKNLFFNFLRFFLWRQFLQGNTTTNGTNGTRDNVPIHWYRSRNELPGLNALKSCSTWLLCQHTCDENRLRYYHTLSRA